MPRLFIALPVPPAVRQRLAGAQERWEAAGLPFRWVRAEGLHLTVVFLGERPQEDVPRLEAAMQRAVAGRAPFRLALTGLGAFPNLGRPRVLWAGLAGDVPALDALRRAVGREVRAARIPFERQPFRPHVTLGRATGALTEAAAEDLRRAALEADRASWGEWLVAAIHLVQSQLRPGGAVYTTLARVALDAAAPPAPGAPRAGGVSQAAQATEAAVP